MNRRQMRLMEGVTHHLINDYRHYEEYVKYCLAKRIDPNDVRGMDQKNHVYAQALQAMQMSFSAQGGDIRNPRWAQYLTPEPSSRNSRRLNLQTMARPSGYYEIQSNVIVNNANFNWEITTPSMLIDNANRNVPTSPPTPEMMGTISDSTSGQMIVEGLRERYITDSQLILEDIEAFSRSISPMPPEDNGV